MISHKKHKEAQEEVSNPWKSLRSVRSPAADNLKSKRGAAIVELALAMLLMTSMIVFSVFVCRALSQRNRALAASRTAAWLYTHADKPEGDDSVETTAFRNTLSQWHFGAKDPTSVSLSIEGGSGLIAKSDANNIMNVVSSELDTQKEAAGAGALDGTSIPKVTDKSPSSLVGECFSEFVVGAVNWLTDDFKFYRAEVQVSTPLIFGPEAYQLFGWLEGVDHDTKSAMMNPIFIGSCTMPMQNGGEGVGDPFGNLTDKVQEITGWLQKLLDGIQNNAVYRPYDMGKEPSEIDKKAFYALLSFELYDPDHDSLKTERPGGWQGGMPDYHSKNTMDALLDAAKAGDYEAASYKRRFY